jgi:sporulation protein YlmC with PRC-barrel domain
VRGLTGDPEATPLQFGRPVQGKDGPAGRLADIVVDPEARRVTHLVVEDEDGIARLVPAKFLVPGRLRDRVVVLSFSKADVTAFDSIRSFVQVGLDRFPRDNGSTAIGVEDTLLVPSFGAAEFGGYGGGLDESYGITYDRIPAGSVELRRASLVVAADGRDVGHVDGFLVKDGDITHIVLQSQYRWWTRPLAIAIESVDTIETDRITVALPKDAVAAARGPRSRWLPFA